MISVPVHFLGARLAVCLFIHALYPPMRPCPCPSSERGERSAKSGHDLRCYPDILWLRGGHQSCTSPWKQCHSSCPSVSIAAWSSKPRGLMATISQRPASFCFAQPYGSNGDTPHCCLISALLETSVSVIGLVSGAGSCVQPRRNKLRIINSQLPP